MSKGGIVFLASIGFLAASACSSGNHTPVADAGGPTATCGNTTVEDQSEKDCSTCTTSTTCTSETPLKVCCTYAGQPTAPLARATGLHRFSAPQGASSAPDLSCLTSPGTLGTPQTVTLVGYVWLFDTGTDSAGVQVQVFKENNPNTDGSIASTPLGTYTTTMSDPTYPVANTTWNTNCTAPGCSYRQYTITGVPTETPLVIKTSDAAGGSTWATLYDYNIYFPNAAVENEGGTPTVHYDATAASSGDPNTVAGSLGFTVTSGVIAGEVHDCWTDPDGYVGGVRLSGATVGSSVLPEGNQIYYSNDDEASPLLASSATSTTTLGLYGGINYPTGVPIRVTAVGEDPANPGKFLMLGTYVVQTFPSAVTALSLRGRRPWQP